MKFRKKRKIIISVFLVFALIVAGPTVYAFTVLNRVERKVISQKPEDLGIDESLFTFAEDSGKESRDVISSNSDNKQENSGKEENNTKAFDNITNIALFGIDAEKGETGRSDAIMILTLDSDRKKLKLTSIMRDSYVNIEGRGQDKINHAYAFGGPQLAIKTLNQNFRLNIKDYFSVNFSTLPQVIDALGGVSINIKDYEMSIMQYHGISKAGTYNLNGEQALEYSRIRYVGNGDYERTERQRTVLDAVFNKLINTDKTKMPLLISKFLPMLETSLSNTDILKMGMDVLDMKPSELQLQRYPLDNFSEGKFIGEIWYLTFDTEATKEQIFKYIFEDQM